MPLGGAAVSQGPEPSPLVCSVDVQLYVNMAWCSRDFEIGMLFFAILLAGVQDKHGDAGSHPWADHR